jgi:hypothetical protein
MRAKLLRSGRSQAVKLISVVVFRFRQKGVKLSRGGVILKLAVPCGCIECRKPAPELGQGRGFESFDSLLQGFQIGHGLSVRFTAHQSVANRLASPPPQTANGRCTAKQQLVCNTTAGVQLNSRAAVQPGCRDLPLEPPQRLPYAIGRSPSWPSLRANPKHRKGSVGAPGRLQRIANQT